MSVLKTDRGVSELRGSRIIPAASDPRLRASAAAADDLARNVYCVLGVPIDALDMAAILRRIEAAAASRAPFLISTPNSNFLVHSRSDPEFRESVLDSDLSPADGMLVVWISRLVGIPIKKRMSGSDIFEALKVPNRGGRQLKVLGYERGVWSGCGASRRNPTCGDVMGTTAACYCASFSLAFCRSPSSTDGISSNPSASRRTC
jgi:hypothetical protein